MNTDPLDGDETFPDPQFLWAVPLDEPEPASLPFPAPPLTPPDAGDDAAPFLMEFPGSDAPPPLGFTPRLRRDNEAA
jgi:hypothetical protein